MPEENVIVEITEKVRGFQFNGHFYTPGERVKIPTALFRADFMRKLADATEGMKAGVTLAPEAKLTAGTSFAEEPEPSPEPEPPQEVKKPEKKAK